MLLAELTCSGTCLQQIKALNHVFERKANLAGGTSPPAAAKGIKVLFKEQERGLGWGRESSRHVAGKMLPEPPARSRSDPEIRLRFWAGIVP